MVDAAPAEGTPRLDLDLGACTERLVRIIVAQRRDVTEQQIPQRALSILRRWFETIRNGFARAGFSRAHEWILEGSSRASTLRLRRGLGLITLVAAACFVLACKATADPASCLRLSRRDFRYAKDVLEDLPDMNPFHLLLLTTAMGKVLRRPRTSRVIEAEPKEERPHEPVYDCRTIIRLENTILNDLDWVLTDPVEIDFVHLLTEGVSIRLRELGHSEAYVGPLIKSMRLMCEITLFMAISSPFPRLPGAKQAPALPTWKNAQAAVCVAIAETIQKQETRAEMCRWVSCALGERTDAVRVARATVQLKHGRERYVGIVGSPARGRKRAARVSSAPSYASSSSAAS